MQAAGTMAFQRKIPTAVDSCTIICFINKAISN